VAERRNGETLNGLGTEEEEARGGHHEDGYQVAQMDFARDRRDRRKGDWMEEKYLLRQPGKTYQRNGDGLNNRWAPGGGTVKR